MKISSKLIYFFGALGGLLFGYDTGIISGADAFIMRGLGVVSNSLEDGVIVASVLVGAAIGALSAGKLSDIIGRKKSLLISSVIFCIGALASGLAPSATVIIIARIILGVAVGSASAIVPMYLSELAPTSRRGSLAFLNQLMIVLGILLSYITNYLFVTFGSDEWNVDVGWRIALGAAVLPAAIMLVGACLLPESPRFLVRVGDRNGAREVLATLRPASEVDAEIAEIQRNLSAKVGSISELFSKFVRPALFIGAGLAFFQQFMGVNTVIYYAPKILETTGLDYEGQRLVTVGIGVMNVVATIVAIAIVDKINRRTLFTVGGIVMAVSIAILAWIDFAGVDSSNPALAQIVASFGLMVYIIAFGITWGGTMWVVLGEIFPLHIRGIGVGVASMVNWASNFTVSLLFPFILGHPAEAATENTPAVSATMLEGHPFWLFIVLIAFCIIGILFVRLFVFETRGKSLEEIEYELQLKAK